MSDKVNASLKIECNVECPHCDEYIDIYDIDAIDDEGNLSRQILKGQGFGCKNLNLEIECPECKQKFTIGEVEW